MTRRRALTGILAPVGKARPTDLEAFAQAKLNLIRLRAQVNPIEDLTRWRNAGALDSILHLLSPLPGQHSVSVTSYVEEFSRDIEAYLNLGGKHVEVHDEPNRRVRGMGVSWQDGIAFSAWFSAVADNLRSRFGKDISIGFPAFAPAKMPRPEASAPLDDAPFLNACRDSLVAADWAALHIYWRNRDDMRAYDSALQFLRLYLERFPEQRFAITEYANVNDELSASERGQQYSEFITFIAQYPQIWATSALLLRSNDPRYSNIAWTALENTNDPIIRMVSARPGLPDPSRLWFTWPTDNRHYIHCFGESQRTYYANYGLAGGHNGVDLAVSPTSPETSPVYAAYPGTVQQVAMDTDGYTRHVRVQGYGPDREALTLLYAHLSGVDVKMGMLVERGDVLGWGSNGRGQEHGAEDAPPYMHFSLRIEGVELPATLNWVNPQPYLDAVPRGEPTSDYVRTYVLLPPKVGVDWAIAAVQATWRNKQFTLGASADDAGIGDLASRQVVVVNPELWKDDMATFYKFHFPNVIFAPLTAATPEELEQRLTAFPSVLQTAVDIPLSVQGRPRMQYKRTYVLLPPAMPVVQVTALLKATWGNARYTLGTHIDDAAIGDLDERTIIAVLPEAWKTDLRAYYDYYYPGVTYIPIQANTFSELVQKVRAALETP